MHVKIVPLHLKDERLLEVVSSGIQEILEVSTELVQAGISLNEGWSSERNQFNSSWILSRLLNELPGSSFKILGITDYDLYMPIMTYVFGEAELGGKAALISVYRFRDELYGLPPNKSHVEMRAIKEAVHELGHTFGLIHCRNQECVMRSSTYVEEIDQKSESFCGDCVRILANNQDSQER